jgi:hypothetical protein
MISGNIFLIKYLGILFLSVGLIRTQIKNEREKELKNFGLPNNFDYFIILFEISMGLILLLNTNYEQCFLIILLIILIIRCVLIIINNFNTIVNNALEVFTFQPTPMSVALHFTYIIIIISILLNYK